MSDYQGTMIMRLNFRTVSLYVFNTLTDSANLMKITNLYDLINRFIVVTVINRLKTGSHKFSNSLNYIIF